MVSLFISIVLVAAAFFAQSLWHSWILTCAIVFAGILILHTLKPYLDALAAKLSGKVPVHVARDENPDPIPGRGVRILVATRETAFDTGTEAGMSRLDGLVADAVASLSEKNPLFRLRYDTVLEKKLPRQVCWAMTGDKDAGMRRCYRSWLSDIGAKNFGTWKQDSELFMYDGVFPNRKNTELLACAVIFLFDTRLPTA